LVYLSLCVLCRRSKVVWWWWDDRLLFEGEWTKGYHKQREPDSECMYPRESKKTTSLRTKKNSVKKTSCVNEGLIVKRTNQVALQSSQSNQSFQPKTNSSHPSPLILKPIITPLHHQPPKFKQNNHPNLNTAKRDVLRAAVPPPNIPITKPPTTLSRNPNINDTQYYYHQVHH
jgi:hypothetical protein